MPTKREKRAKQKDEYADVAGRLEKKDGDFTGTYLKVPEDIPLFAPSKEEHRLIFLPYRVGEGNPYADKGKLHFERTFWTHRGIGPNKRTYCCPAKVANKKCPVCVWVEKQRKKMDEDELKELDLFPKERQLFLVIDTEDREKGVQLFDFSFHLLGKQLDAKLRRIQSKNEKDSKLRFWRLEGGKLVIVEFDEKKFQGKPYYTAAGFSFKDRKKDPDVSLDDLPCLDDIPYVLNSDKLKEIFLQTPEADDEDEDDDEDTKKKKKKGKKREDDDEEEEEDDDDDGDSDDEEDDEEEDEDSDDEGDGDDDDDSDDDESTDDDEDDGDEDDSDDDEDEDEDDEDEEDSDDEDSDDDDEDDEEDEEDDDEDGDDEDEKPVKKKGKKSKRDVPFDTDDEEDDDEEEEDEEEDEEDDESDDDEDDEEDESDSDDPTADEAGIEVGLKVQHKKYGICKVVHISPDGTSLRLETKGGETKRGVAPAEVKLLEKGKKSKK